jgi:hypothetical protein
MPRPEWVRTRAFGWLTALLHFDKVLQLPIVVAHRATGVSYRRILESFSEGDLSAWPVLTQVREFFRDYARAIQNGGPEYVRSEQFLNIYWPADEFILIQLVHDGKIDAFYEEAGDALLAGLGEHAPRVRAIVQDAIRLNQALLKRPFVRDTLSLPLRYNVWEYYRGALVGDDVPLEERSSLVSIDRATQSWWSWDDYCREVIWYGNKKGAYLYDYKSLTTGVESQIAGIY